MIQKGRWQSLTIKRAVLIFLAGIAILIAISAIGLQTLPLEYFGKEGLLATRYEIALEWLIFLLYVAPLIILVTVLIAAGGKLSLKWAALILLVSSTLIIAGVPFIRSMLPPEYLADSGIKAALYKIIAISLGMLLLLVPFGIFLNALMEAGKDKKTRNYQGLFDLRIKAGPRWFFMMAGVGMAVLFTLAGLDSGVNLTGIDGTGLAILLAFCAFLVWLIGGSIRVFFIRVRYDDVRIIATTRFFGDREHRWADSLKIKDMTEGKPLIFGNTGTARIPEYLEGYDDLMEHANKVLNDA